MLKSIFYSLLNKYSENEFNSAMNVHKMYGFSEPAAQKMQSIIEMFHNTFVLLSFILVAIALILLLTIYYFRSDKNPYPIRFGKNVEYIVDALFVAVPIIIIYYSTIPAIGFILHSDRLVFAGDSLFTVEIIGHQWYWTYVLNSLENKYIYDLITVVKPEGLNYNTEDFYRVEIDQYMDLEAQMYARLFEVNKHVILPVGESIRCIITSEDVIHSWAMPQLGIKVDAVPGRIQSFILKADRCGVYYGQCSELCGVNHGFMPIVVEFVTAEAFYDWFCKAVNHRNYEILFDILNIHSMEDIERIEALTKGKTKTE